MARTTRPSGPNSPSRVPADHARNSLHLWPGARRPGRRSCRRRPLIAPLAFVCRCARPGSGSGCCVRGIEHVPRFLSGSEIGGGRLGGCRPGSGGLDGWPAGRSRWTPRAPCAPWSPPWRRITPAASSFHTTLICEMEWPRSTVSAVRGDALPVQPSAQVEVVTAPWSVAGRRRCGPRWGGSVRGSGPGVVFECHARIRSEARVPLDAFRRRLTDSRVRRRSLGAGVALRETALPET